MIQASSRSRCFSGVRPQLRGVSGINRRRSDNANIVFWGEFGHALNSGFRRRSRRDGLVVNWITNGSYELVESTRGTGCDDRSLRHRME